MFALHSSYYLKLPLSKISYADHRYTMDIQPSIVGIPVVFSSRDGLAPGVVLVSYLPKYFEKPCGRWR